jgi:hypothetical protein
MNGKDFAHADFGSNYPVQDGYTILESTTGNVFIHMIQSTLIGAEHGTIFKSNWNGTFYHKVIETVNQNRNGYVDFEKIAGLNGTMIVNQIKNPDELPKGSAKKLISLMSYDDGETWKRLPAPLKDSNGKFYRCEKNCYLNLHAFTERHDRRDTYSSVGAVGLMIGVGNGSLIKEMLENI